MSLSLLAMAGVPVKVAQARAGHSSPIVTLTTYVHMVGEADRRAAEALAGVMAAAAPSLALEAN